MTVLEGARDSSSAPCIKLRYRRSQRQLPPPDQTISTKNHGSVCVAHMTRISRHSTGDGFAGPILNRFIHKRQLKQVAACCKTNKKLHRRVKSTGCVYRCSESSPTLAPLVANISNDPSKSCFKSKTVTENCLSKTRKVLSFHLPKITPNEGTPHNPISVSVYPLSS